MLHLLNEAPVPIYHLNTPTDWQSIKLVVPILMDFELMSLKSLQVSLDFRCVAFDRLQTVLQTGVDVEPADMPIYVADYKKALEYGGSQKIMLVYDTQSLHRTYREVAVSTPDSELTELSNRFPTRLISEDGTRFWYSRLPEGHYALSSDYEIEYARWIPGDPFDALKAIILIGQFSEDDLKQVSTLYGNASQQISMRKI